MTTHGCSHANYQTIRSTHPEVATLTAIPDGVRIKTGTAGATELQLLDEQGQIVDTTPIDFREIARYEGPNNMSGPNLVLQKSLVGPGWVLFS